MKSFLSIFVSGVVVCAVLASCNRSVSSKPVTVEFDTIRVQSSFPKIVDSLSPHCSMDAIYLYPKNIVNSTDSVLKNVCKILNTSFFESDEYANMEPQVALKKYFDGFVSVFNQKTEIIHSKWNDEEETEASLSLTKKIHSDVLYNKNRILSYQIVSEDMKNGTKEITSYQNLVFNLKNGQQLKEQDIFNRGYSKFLNTILQRKLMEQNNVGSVSELFDLGYWGIEDISTNTNFYVDDKGITYLFNPGEYSAISLGVSKVFLSYADLKYVLNPDSPISALFDK